MAISAEQLDWLARKHAELATTNFFQLLELSDTPTIQQVKDAFHQLTKQCHPDVFFTADTTVQSQAKAVFEAIKQAADTLATVEGIIGYRQLINGEEAVSDDPTRIRIVRVHAILKAEQLFTQGQQGLVQRRYSRAAQAFAAALEISPTDALFMAHYGWALYNIANERDADAEELAMRPRESLADLQFLGRQTIDRAIELGRDSTGRRSVLAATGHYFKGLIYLGEGIEAMAEGEFERALHYNPSHLEALRQQRLITLRRRQAAAKPKSRWQRFWDRLSRR